MRLLDEKFIRNIKIVVTCMLVAFVLIIFGLIASSQNIKTPAPTETSTPQVVPSVTNVVDNEVVYIDASLNRPDIDAHYPRPDACRTYNIGGYDSTSGIECDKPNINVVYVKNNSKDVHDPTPVNTPEPTSVPTDIPDTPEPEETPLPPKNDKAGCNNGGGNGAEGCNASEKGNNDETP